MALMGENTSQVEGRGWGGEGGGGVGAGVTSRQACRSGRLRGPRTACLRRLTSRSALGRGRRKEGLVGEGHWSWGGRGSQAGDSRGVAILEKPPKQRGRLLVQICPAQGP